MDYNKLNKSIQHTTMQEGFDEVEEINASSDIMILKEEQVNEIKIHKN